MWSGLPVTQGKQPDRIGANLFFLGCALDGGGQLATVTWREAQMFLFGTVPATRREDVWLWIVREHTLPQWRRKYRRYRLHRMRAYHERIYRFAQVFAELLVKSFRGDVRRIWRDVPTEVEAIDHVRSVLHVMRVGPAISRMMVGALTDHRLVRGATAFKDDRHVKRGMRELGLAQSGKSTDVLKAGKQLFGKNNWAVDQAFYRLGENGYKTRRQIERYYHERVTEGRDRLVKDHWRQNRGKWEEIVRDARDKINGQIKGWKVMASAAEADGWIGLSLRRAHGMLAREFSSQSLYAWVGVQREIGDGCVKLYSGVDVHIDGRMSRSKGFRDGLIDARYGCEYEDRYEQYYRELGSYRFDVDPEGVRKKVVRALSRGALDLVSRLSAAS